MLALDADSVSLGTFQFAPPVSYFEIPIERSTPFSAVVACAVDDGVWIATTAMEFAGKPLPAATASDFPRSVSAGRYGASHRGRSAANV